MSAQNQHTHHNQLGLLASTSPCNISTNNASSHLYKIDMLQSFNWDLQVNQSQIPQLNSYDHAFNDAYETPVTSFNFDFIETNGLNFAKLGFFNTTGFLVRDIDSDFCKNFYLLKSNKNGNDLESTNNEIFSGDSSLIAFGNCYPTNISIGAATRGLCIASIDYIASYCFNQPYTPTGFAPNVGESGNVNNSTTYSINKDTIDAINPESDFGKISVSRNIIANFPSSNLPSYQNIFLQSVNVDVPIQYESREALGEFYIKQRKPIFPIIGNLSFSANCVQENFNHISGFLTNQQQNLEVNFENTSGVYMKWVFYNSQITNISQQNAVNDSSRFEAQAIFNTRNFYISGADGGLLTSSISYFNLFENNSGDSITGLNFISTGNNVLSTNILTF